VALFVADMTPFTGRAGISVAWPACKVRHSNGRTRKNTFYCPAGRASRHVLAKATLMSCVCVFLWADRATNLYWERRRGRGDLLVNSQHGN